MKKKFPIFVAFMTSFLPSCKKFIDVPLPETETVREVVFSSNTTANSALIAIYSQMEVDAFFSDITSLTGLYSDEFVNYSNISSNVQFYNNRVLADNPNVGSIWARAYKYIYQCNSVLEGLQNSSIDKSLSNQLIGEALFLRSYLYFCLSNFYGAVPLVLSTDYLQNSRIPRTSVDSIYKQIIFDSVAAEGLVQDAYLNVTGSGTSTKRFRANKNVLRAFLAKLFLYNKEYLKADSISSIVINDNSYGLDTTLSTTFLNSSREAILQVPDDIRINTLDAINFVLSTAPSFVAVNPNKGFLKDSTDRRVKSWLGTFVDQSDTFYFPNKYKIVNSPLATESLVIFRLAEQYLIRAEARYYLNDFQASVSDVNVIRHRAGLLPYSYDVSSSLLDEIFRQRDIELMFENGNRWFDIRRSENANNIMERVVASKGGTWQNFRFSLPIPATEISKNNLLVQNSGY